MSTSKSKTTHIVIPILIRVTPDGDFEAVGNSDYKPERYADELLGGSDLNYGLYYDQHIVVHIPRSKFASLKDAPIFVVEG